MTAPLGGVPAKAATAYDPLISFVITLPSRPHQPIRSFKTYLACDIGGGLYLVKEKSNVNPRSLSMESDAIRTKLLGRHNRMIALESHLKALRSTDGGRPSPLSRMYLMYEQELEKRTDGARSSSPIDKWCWV